METKTSPFRFKKEISLGTALSILVPLIIGLVVWGFTTSGVLTSHSNDLERIEMKVQKNTDSVYNLQKDIQKEMKEDKKEFNEKLEKILHVLIEKK